MKKAANINVTVGSDIELELTFYRTAMSEKALLA